MKTILYVIDSLSVGGAERLLVETINNLPEFRIVVVTLYPGDDLLPELNCHSVHCLDFKGKLTIPTTVLKLRKLITSYCPDIVHAHLLWSTFIARLATPKSIPFYFSVHSTLSKDAFGKNKLSLFLEKVTYKPWHTAIFVSEYVKSDYDQSVGLRGPAHVLYNFIPDQFFQNFRLKPDNKLEKFVAVGNLKEAKNYQYLIEAFKILKEKGVSATLDIYGQGYLQKTLQQEIDKYQLPIKLKGTAKNIHTILPQYDAYVLCSMHEGFGLAPVEAMAVGLPVFLSDIPIMHEVSGGHAVFFNPQRPEDFAGKVQEAMGQADKLKLHAEQAHAFALKLASHKSYLKGLYQIYGNSLK
ncbi:glycosyltransferase [Adhaeribacter soli]|uniref:glycosyltransferase n=1 Tax=Adhaeribacter soli TaxID=2607655 RepID=UPI00177F317B|nr:glycosyltransferase [Adhaeribacter soli]